MKRIATFPQRVDMQAQLLEVGFDYYNLPSTDGSNYWSDNVAYEFTLAEIDRIEDATNELHAMCLDFVADEVMKGDYQHYQFTDLQKQLIEQSWSRKDLSLYGRFDFGYDGSSLKMFEYNADTPTSLLEASVVQWKWLEQVENLQHRDQFNWIHEALVKRFQDVKQITGKSSFHFSGMQEAGREDWGNIDYLCDVAYLAGWNIHQLAIEDIGYDEQYKEFVDLNNRNIELIFKLCPLEWFTNVEFAQYIPHSHTKFFEPMWKLLLSNKILLAKLWQKHKRHDLLLPAYFKPEDNPRPHRILVKKPILGREGANISYCELENKLEFAAKGSEHSEFYNRHGYIYQEKFNMPSFDGMYPMIGSWIVGDEACGMGLREDFTPVTGNDSHFVPHYFVE
ncbi:glutathionylspermidine synthase family protein [Mannheimia massilioguelmaensis]|uniref:glutathionylspermidine synthase family protein n=1 Tax=Mannheimia massilioguelmaensis TaxID=1604354 RepID=UPI0005CA978E|nr:glutathionylspermidine synthase family protein [Mannheimia massilioguelmaensis]